MAADKRIEVTPEMSAYAIFDKLTGGLSMIDMISTAELEALRRLLDRNVSYTNDMEKDVLQSMLRYVNTELVADKMNKAASLSNVPPRFPK